MAKRNFLKVADEDNDDCFIPIPIQFFFWNQTSLFLKQKFGVLTEAHAKNFERVLVQNILHGLSPGLSDAINKISRWKLIKTSFPHIIHACASTLSYRRDNYQQLETKLNLTEIKLLSTLHWLLLNAINECSTDDSSSDAKQILLYPISSIQLFIYQLTPLVNVLKEDNFNNDSLSSGLKIWQALWSCKTPDLEVFSNPIKRKTLKLKLEKQAIELDRRYSMARLKISKSMSFNKNTSDTSDYSDTDSVANFTTILLKTVGNDYIFDSLSSNLNRPPVVHLNSICNLSEIQSFDGDYLHDKDYETQKRNDRILSASYFDVGVIRCLLSPKWNKYGYEWALGYLNNRMNEISDVKNDNNTTNLLPKSISESCLYDLANKNNNNRTFDLLNEIFTLTSRRNYSVHKTESSFHKRISRLKYIDDDKFRLKIFSFSDRKSSFDSIKSTKLKLSKRLSQSDTCLNYKEFYENTNEIAQECSSLVNNDGSINYSIILKSVHSVIKNENNEKFSELALNILDNLINFDLLLDEQNENRIKDLLKESVFDDRLLQLIKKYLNDTEFQYNQNFTLSIDLLLRIIKWLDCPNCNSNLKTFQLDQLRHKTKNILEKIFKYNQAKFEEFFKEFIENNEIKNIIDTFHAFLLFCDDTTYGFSHYYPFVQAKLNHQFQIARVILPLEKCVVSTVFKPLVNRLLLIRDDLLSQELIYVYQDVRLFLWYIKENHLDTFRTVAYSSMLEPLVKFKRQTLERIEKIEKLNQLIHKEENLLANFNKQISLNAKGDTSLITFDLEIESIDSTDNFTRRKSSIMSTPRRLMHLKNSSNHLNVETESQKQDYYKEIKDSYDKNVLLRQKLINEEPIIDSKLISKGLSQFTFLAECLPPGVIVDLPFMDAFFDLNAPCLTKIAILVELAYFISRCNKNEWPEWLKMSFGATGIANNTSKTSVINMIRRNRMFKLAAAHLFNAWGEILAKKLEEFNDLDTNLTVEDYFLPNNSTPYSYVLAICLVLYEISSFLRETYAQMPKKILTQARSRTTTDRRLNVSTGSVYSNDSNSLKRTLSSIENETSSKHISFACKDEDLSSLGHEYERVSSFGMKSLGSSGLSASGAWSSGATAPRLSQLRLSVKRSSLKRRKSSLKLNFSGKPEFSSVSQISEEYHREEKDSLYKSSHMSTVVNDTISEQYEIDDIDINKPFIWIKSIIKVMKSTNYECNHEQCDSTCHLKRWKSTQTLMEALKRIYEESDLLKKSTSIDEHKESIGSQRLFYMNNLINKLNGDYQPIPNLVYKLNETKNSINSYLLNESVEFNSFPLKALCKCVLIMTDDHFEALGSLTWNLLLSTNHQVISYSSCLFLISALKVPNYIEDLIHEELKDKSVTKRHDALLKFEKLWKYRYYVYPNLEIGANHLFKIAPPCIDFTLPSPLIGIQYQPIVDPPWLPKAKTKVEEVNVNQEQIKAVVTASRSRKKQQQEILLKALQTEEQNKKIGREKFLLLNIPYIQNASNEPFLVHQQKDDQEEASEIASTFTANSRRQSIASTYKRKSILGERFYSPSVNEMDTANEVQQSQPIFPPSIAAFVPSLIDMLKDHSLIENKQELISSVAKRILWKGLIDDTALFLRCLFEKITQKKEKDMVINYLKCLINEFKVLPSQTSFILFNYLLGLVMHYTRQANDETQEAILSISNLIGLVIKQVNGLVYRDFKQILRKEQFDSFILLTANLPHAKKLIVHGPDLTQIPTHCLIQEDTLFYHLMRESFDFFSIPDIKRNCYYLYDIKTSQIRLPDAYVRDFYSFHRNLYPQLNIVQLDAKEAVKELEKVAFVLKSIEQSKVHIYRTLVNTQLKVDSLLDELVKLPLFPRKALEADFNLYSKLNDKELLTSDMLHKYAWVQLIWSLLSTLDGKTSSVWDITLFINCLNGALILHSEDINIVRQCFSVYLGIAKKFKTIFSINGFLFVMPAILKVYLNSQMNYLIKSSIEFLILQFYLMHRVPFALQLFGSIANLLDTTVDSKDYSTSLLAILLAIEKPMSDDLRILDLVHLLDPNYESSNSIDTHSNSKNGKSNSVLNLVNEIHNNGFSNGLLNSNGANVQPLDFCYFDETNSKFSLIDSINLCITVIAYASYSKRAYQMLTILNELIPQFMNYLKNQSERDANYLKNETQLILKLIVSIKTLIKTFDNNSRTFHVPLIEANLLFARNHVNKLKSGRSSSLVGDDDESAFKFNPKKDASVDDRKIKLEVRLPRNMLLNIVSEFYASSNKRLRELEKLLNTNKSQKTPELLDFNAHEKLADLAYSLFKFCDEANSINNRGLHNYFKLLLSQTDWSQENLKPIIINLLRRIERIFSKNLKKLPEKKNFDWDTIVSVLVGFYQIISKNESLVRLSQFRLFIISTISLLFVDSPIDTQTSFNTLNVTKINNENQMRVPLEYSKALIKLVGKYIDIEKDQCNFESLLASIQPHLSGLSCLIHFLIPLLIWTTTERDEAPSLGTNDTQFLVGILLNVLKPPTKLANTIIAQATPTKQGSQIQFDLNSNNQFSNKSAKQIKEILNQGVFLALKLLTLHLSRPNELIRIFLAIKQLCAKFKSIHLWKFIEFICTQRNELFLLMKPFIEDFISNTSCETQQESQIRSKIKSSLQGILVSNDKPKEDLLQDLIIEFNSIKAEFFGSSKQDLKSSKHQIVDCEPVKPQRPSRQSSINESSLLEQLTEEDNQQLLRTNNKFNRIEFKNGLALLDSFIKTNTLKFTQPKLFSDKTTSQKLFSEQQLITSKNLKRKSIIRKDSLPRRRQSNELLMTWRAHKAVSFEQDNNEDEKCKKF